MNASLDAANIQLERKQYLLEQAKNQVNQIKCETDKIVKSKVGIEETMTSTSERLLRAQSLVALTQKDAKR